jgi:cell division protein FtsA
VSLHDHGLTPRLKPLSIRKRATLSVLDVGTSKIVCLIAELRPAEAGESLRGRTHLARVIGIGHHRSLGLKGGAIVDLDAAETAIRGAIHAAERMAKVEVQSVIVNMTGGRLASHHFDASVTCAAAACARPISAACLRWRAGTRCGPAARFCTHSRPGSRSTASAMSSRRPACSAGSLGVDLTS